MSGINQSEMLVGLDIGTSKVVAVVAEIASEDNIEIIGLGTQPSRGSPRRSRRRMGLS